MMTNILILIFWTLPVSIFGHDCVCACVVSNILFMCPCPYSSLYLCFIVMWCMSYIWSRCCKLFISELWAYFTFLSILSYLTDPPWLRNYCILDELWISSLGEYSRVKTIKLMKLTVPLILILMQFQWTASEI
jgi:hypothetical protein